MVAASNAIGVSSVFETDAFKRGLNEYLSGLTKASQQTTQATGQMSQLGSTGGKVASGGMNLLSGAVMGVGFAIANTLVGAVQGAISAIGQMGAMGIQAVATLQDMTITLESLAAREIVAAGGAENIAAAMDQAGPMAQYLLEQIKKLSIVSPFEYSQVVGVFNMSMAFGQSSEMALKLTKAITDMAAINKSVPGVIERITYNFNQMSLVGQITQRDIRDLAQAGVNFSDVLKSQLGKTLEETNAALKSGELTFKDVSEAFVKYTEENFGGAAQKASRTLGGLASSFKDLTFFAAQDILGPSLNRITGSLGSLLDKAIEFVDSGALQNIGAALDIFTEAIINNTVGEDFSYGFLFDMQSGLKEAADSAATWGTNIVYQLAEGIIQGAAGALNAAMDFIGNMLAFWMAPGSPPRVAPDLDMWGTSAMNEYLKGFTDADFDLLDALQDPLKKAFDLLESSGALGAGGAEQMFADISKQMIEAFSGGGQVDASFFDQITASAGEFGASIAQLAKDQLALSNAEGAVAQAEAAILAARKREEQAGLKVNRMTQEYNDLLRSGASKDVLKRKLAEINAAEEERKLAGEAATEAENQVDIAKEQLDFQKAQFDMQKKLVDQLLEIAQAQQRAREEAEKAAKAAQDQAKETGGGAGAGEGEGAGGGGAIEPPTLPDLGDIGSLEDTINDAKERMLESLRGLWQGIIDDIKQRLGPALDEFKKAWQRVVDFLSPIWENIKKGWALVTGFLLGNVKEFVGFWKGWWAEHGQSVKEIVGAVWEFLKNIFKGGFLIIATIVRAGLRGFMVWWSKYGADVKNILSRTWNAIKANFKDLMEFFGDIFDAFAALLRGDWKTFWQKIREAANDIWRIIKRTWETTLANIRDIAKIYLGSLKDFWDATMRHLRDLAEWLRDRLSETWEAIRAKASALWEKIKTVISVAWNTTVTVIQKLASDLRDYLEEKWNETKAKADAIWKAIKALVSALWEQTIDAVKALALELYTYLNTKWTEIKTSVDTTWKSIKTTLTTLWDQAVAAAKAKVEELRTYIETKTGAILTNISTWLSSILTSITNQFTNIYNAGEDLIEQLKAGIDYILPNALSSITTWLSGVLTAIGNEFTNLYNSGVSIIQNILDGAATIGANIASSVATYVSNAATIAEDIWTSIKTVGEDIIKKVIAGIDSLGSGIASSISSYVSAATSIAETVWSDIKTIGSTIISKIGEGISYATTTISDYVKTAVSGAGDKISELYNDLKGIGSSILSSIGDGISAVLNISNLGDNMKSALRDMISNVFGTLNGNNGYYATFVQVGKNLLSSIGNGISDVTSAIVNQVTGAVQSIVDAIKELLGIESPSKVTRAFGKLSMKGFALGWEDEARSAALVIANATRQAISPVIAAARQPVMAGASVQSSTNYSYAVNMGGVNIYNQMDDAAFEARMLRIMRRASR